MPNTGVDGFQLVDIDGNKIPEIVISGFHGWYEVGQPLRKQTDIYQWNGKAFTPTTIYESPQYRFQAVQDGDRDTTQGDFAGAFAKYQDVIESNNLNWWSQERLAYNITLARDGTASPIPAPDTSEYPRLAAYAYYRIMLLHLVQGNESDATIVYTTLGEKFGNDPYARPYVEMASAFWDAYQSTQKMYDGCAAAIQYAAEHPEILTPLGSDYHGAQSHTYVPADVCPFR